MDPSNTANLLTRCAQIGIALILVIAPFPFGSVAAGWIFTLETGVCFLLVLWAAAQIAAGEVQLVRVKLIWPVLALLVYALFTVVPLAPKIVEFLSAQTFWLYSSAADFVGASGKEAPAEFRISLAPFETEGEILKIAAYVLFFYLSLNLLRHREAYLAVYRLLIAVGATIAFLGLVQNVWSNGKIYWIYEPGSGSPFGPFPNHNHFAGYLELCLGLALGMLLMEIQNFRERVRIPGLRGYLAWAWHGEGSRPWLMFCASFVMIAALTASLSRGGVLSFVLTCLLFSLKVLLFGRKSAGAPGPQIQKHRRLLVTGALAAILILIGTLAYAPRVRKQWSTTFESSASYRLETWSDSLKALSDFPLTGSGLGSFRSLFPRYKSGSFSSETTHAESEYLEWAFETGFAGSILLLCVGLAYARQVVFRLSNRRSVFARSLGYGAVFSMVCLSIHNAIDFNTHIPSNAVTVVAISALCLLVINFRKGRHGTRFMLGLTHYPAGSYQGIAVLAIAFVAAGLLGTRAFIRYQSLRLESQWINDKSLSLEGDPDERQLAPLTSALRWSRWNDRAHYFKAAAYEQAAAGKGLFEFTRKKELLELADSELARAVLLRPSQATYWAALGRIAGRKQRDEPAEKAFRQALLLAGSDGFIHRDYGVILLARGELRRAAAQFTLARNYAPSIDLRNLLDILGAATSDPRVWKSIVKYQPGDLRIYAGFLHSRGLTEAAKQLEREATELQKQRSQPQDPG